MATASVRTAQSTSPRRSRRTRPSRSSCAPPHARIPLSIAADTRIAPSTLRFVRISLAHLAQSPLLTPPNLPWPPRAITLACLAQSPWLVSLSISLGRLDLPCSPGQSPLTASLDHACSRSITLGPLARSHSATSISLGHLDLPWPPRSPLPASISLACLALTPHCCAVARSLQSNDLDESAENLLREVAGDRVKL